MESRNVTVVRAAPAPGVALATLLLLASCNGSSRSTPSTAGSGGSGGAASSTGGTSTTGGSSGTGAAGDAASGSATVGGASMTGGEGGTTGGTSPTGGTRATSGGAGSSGGEGGNATGGSTASGGTDAGGEGGSGDTDPPPSAPPSCDGFLGKECAGHDCCESPVVPGGTVTVDGVDTELPSFRLDRFEVTVARFRRFMLAQEAWALAGNPVEGAGAHPRVPGSGFKRAWLTELDEWLASGLVPGWRGRTEDSPGAVYGGNPDYLIDGADPLAVNHVPTHLAFAFCIWDGGRLPARVEWLYAAQGGDEQRRFPWGDAPEAQEMFASRPAVSVPTPYPSDTFWQHIGIPVGSHPASAGRFGHDDLATGLREYVRDTAGQSPVLPTGGLIELSDDEELEELNRLMAMSGWESPGAPVVYHGDGVGFGTCGFRCARDLPP